MGKSLVKKKESIVVVKKHPALFVLTWFLIPFSPPPQQRQWHSEADKAIHEAYLQGLVP